jgi:hypothetical protein
VYSVRGMPRLARQCTLLCRTLLGISGEATPTQNSAVFSFFKKKNSVFFSRKEQQRFYYCTPPQAAMRSTTRPAGPTTPSSGPTADRTDDPAAAPVHQHSNRNRSLSLPHSFLFLPPTKPTTKQEHSAPTGPQNPTRNPPKFALLPRRSHHRRAIAVNPTLNTNSPRPRRRFLATEKSAL